MIANLLKEILHVVIAEAPQLVPQIKDTVSKVTNAKDAADWNELIDHIRKSKFGEIDASVDKKIAALDLPDK